jgi:molecular chaperone GrpE
LKSDQVEAILADFRDWLRESAPVTPDESPAADPVDLHTLVGQFVALRQEVNLQTRSVRQQQEQTADAVQRYGACVESLEALQRRQADAQSQVETERLRPLLNGLVEAADAQMLAAREMARVVKALQAADSAAESLRNSRPEPMRTTFLGRLLGIGRIVEEQQNRLADFEARLNDRLTGSPSDSQDGNRFRAMIEGAAAGLAMGLQRLERTLRQHGLEPIAAEGQTFDPEQMEAVEVVPGSTRPGGEVIDEVRRGYRLNGRVFRFSQVRVAK